MPLKTARTGDVIQYRNTSGETRNVEVIAHQHTAPGIPTSATSASGGSLASATYSYRISAVIGGVETQASVAKTQATTGTTSTVTISWVSIASSSPFNGATAFKVYGRTGGSELLMGTVNMPTTQFVDDGSVTPSGALPSATTAVTVISYTPKQKLTTVAKATARTSTSAYFKR